MSHAPTCSYCSVYEWAAVRNCLAKSENGLTLVKTIGDAGTKNASFGNINRADETQIQEDKNMIQRIKKPFGSESAKDLQAAIDAAEARGEYLSDIILSAPCRPDEIFGENGYLLIFQKQEAKANESA